MWSVKIEISWKRENLFKSVAQSKIQNTLVPQLLQVMKFVNVKERVVYSNVACMFPVVFFLHFIKTFRATFPPH